MEGEMEGVGWEGVKERKEGTDRDRQRQHVVQKERGKEQKRL